MLVFILGGRHGLSSVVLSVGVAHVLLGMNQPWPSGWRCMEAGGYKGELLMEDRRTFRTFTFKKKCGNLFSLRIPVRKTLPMKDTRILHLLSA